MGNKRNKLLNPKPYTYNSRLFGSIDVCAFVLLEKCYKMEILCVALFVSKLFVTDEANMWSTIVVVVLIILT